MSIATLISGASQLLTLRGSGPRRGAALANIELVKNGVVLAADGLIVAIGPRAQVEAHPLAGSAQRVDAGGRVVLPGFVDSHTHLIHAASRADEYELRITGASYEEIAKRGGGILNSVSKLRVATSDTLKQRAHKALLQFAAYGTTTIEAKSGYGLDLAGELKLLKLHKELSAEQPLDIVSTFLGAHVIPGEFRTRPSGAKDYISLLIDQLLPDIAAQKLAEFCDVFCERGAFSVAQSKQILEAGKRYGLRPRIHAEQLSRTGGSQLAVSLGSASCDHLEKINRADIRALAKSKTVATLLPGCDFHLGLKQYAPARDLIDSGAIVALATDYNPGTSPTVSMPMILSLACTQLRMTPAEAITAATINSAYSLGRDKQIGSLEVGKLADIAIFDVDDYREIPYYFGMNTCHTTIKRGQIIYSKSSLSTT
ncbi:MAG TPA: imidazolonepropionase [Methylomirabilota bacterium]|nr:imidazolonepropionase [Methylomirabilota bacterium]